MSTINAVLIYDILFNIKLVIPGQSMKEIQKLSVTSIRINIVLWKEYKINILTQQKLVPKLKGIHVHTQPGQNSTSEVGHNQATLLKLYYLQGVSKNLIKLQYNWCEWLVKHSFLSRYYKYSPSSVIQTPLFWPGGCLDKSKTLNYYKNNTIVHYKYFWH